MNATAVRLDVTRIRTRTKASIPILALAAILATGCGSVKSPSAVVRGSTSPPIASGSSSLVTASSTRSGASPSPQPHVGSRYAATPCAAPTNRNLALVTLRGSNKIVVRDISDISNPIR